ncbi:uncharacterized protein LOC143919460 [Arctopsyche grandis]|uniref:uncharacterized protein LOC143919460 n=1 Tax=Arctopsyche grandis TaxID=121162 RepID=UPI00406D8BD3
MEFFPYDVKELFKQIESKPNLWNRSAHEYRNKEAREHDWKAIYTHFEPNFDKMNRLDQKEIGECIMTKWNYIRASFMRTVKHGPPTRRPYVYYDHLKFLLKSDVKAIDAPHLDNNDDTLEQIPEKKLKVSPFLDEDTEIF